MEERIETLQRRIAGAGWAGALINCSRDLFYYAGTTIPSWLAVTPSDYRLFVRGEMDIARAHTPLNPDRVIESRKLQDAAEFLGADNPCVIATELDVMTVSQLGSFRKIFPQTEFANISPVVLKQRMVKEPREIELLKEACAVVHLGHERVLETLREGMTELQLSAEIEDAHRRGGHEGVFFIRLPDFYMGRGPIASGPNLFNNTGVVYSITGAGLTPSMPAGPSRRKIMKGDLIVTDIPVLVNGYHADQSRTYVLGRAPREAKSMYDDLKSIADELIDNIRPGMSSGEICRMALARAGELGRAGQFQSFGPGKRSRLIGHGIGVELNEPPVVMENDPGRIEEGCVIAIDIHMLDRSIGVVKLEDMISVGRSGNEVLNVSPRGLFEL